VPYFYVELPTGEKLYTRIVASNKFPIQFGRYLSITMILIKVAA